MSGTPMRVVFMIGAVAIVLSRTRLALITSTTNQNQEATTTIGAISA
jgi:hypothetical protein